ncbi:MAG: multicopper oxidase domain-containing protein [Acidobacteria bacterium]|nr:multicopper oxidase domain-containing protein [Acidobacteriota bacterium]
MFGADIPILSPNTTRYPGADYYEIVAGAFRQQLSSGLPATGSRLYGYADANAPNFRALGGAIIARKGTPVRIKYSSQLPAQHIIPFDPTIPMGPGIVGAEQNRIAIHLHGGLVPWASDGGPFHWVSPTGAVVGSSNVNWLHNDANALTNDLFYPNDQSSRFMWYHDHAIGTTRTSAYAGLATGYLITDAADDIVDAAYPLAGGKTFILVFQDKVFYNPARDPGFGNVAGPTTLNGAAAGDLWYPYIYEKAIWKMQGNAKAAPIPSAIPEMFGDTMLVNSRVFPTVSVDKGAYRIRTLNACNARFLNLKFVYADASGKEPLGGYLAPTVAPVNAWMIGTEGGLLPNPVQIFNQGRPLNPANLIPWLQAPAERSDMIVDFSQCASNSKVLLYNDAPAPYPVGAPVFDFYPGAAGNPGAAGIQPGTGPNTRTIMQFAVGAAAGLPAALPGLAGANPVLPTVPDPLNGGLKLAANVINGIAVNPVAKEITLNESFDAFGRLEQLVGTNISIGKGQFGRRYMDPATETVQYGSIEIWNVYNLTADVHPMHFHLFNCMVLRRRLFRSFNGTPAWAGLGRGPDPGEDGWKETIKMWPGECTTIAVFVEHPMPAGKYTRDAGGRPQVVVPQAPIGGVSQPPQTSTLPASPRPGINGDEYVYHCHILEHEEHDMMRPLVAR